MTDRTRGERTCSHPLTLSERQLLWHGDSPGMRVPVRRFLPWWRRSPFTTPTEVLRHYRGAH